MSNTFAHAIKKHATHDPSLKDQEALGKPQKSSLGDDHANFLETVLKLIDDGTIHPHEHWTFLKQDVYESLSDEWKARVDQVLPNIVSLLERIMDLHHREEENDSFEMKSLLETLWHAKQRIEDDYDVFIF